nr:MAG TPA: hypothetical protein [Bacteriophage sp.]
MGSLRNHKEGIILIKCILITPFLWDCSFIPLSFISSPFCNYLFFTNVI